MRRSDESIKVLDTTLFMGATQITLTSRNAITTMMYANYLTTANVAFQVMVNSFKPPHWNVCTAADIETWAVHKSMKAHWIAQYKQESKRFYARLKWSIFHPCHHFTLKALEDM